MNYPSSSTPHDEAHRALEDPAEKTAEDDLDDWGDLEDEPGEDDAFDAVLRGVAQAPQVDMGLTPERLMAPDLGVGSTIEGRYELQAVIGRGGFGIIYKARQIATHQPVAVKVMLGKQMIQREQAELATQRFRREMMLVGQLSHPNIVQLIDSGQLESGLMYMVLEYIEGENLAEILEREGALSPGETRRLMTQVLEALSAAHHRGIVHRDLKPHNIMVSSVGARRCAKVLDFGIASVIEGVHGEDLGTLTTTGQIVGTPWYMAPEQLRGERTLQSDIYAWGLIFLECLTGQRVIPGRTAPKAIQVQLDDAPLELPSPWRSSSFGPLLRRALEKTPAQRFADVEEVLLALESGEVMAGASGPVQRVSMPSTEIVAPAPLGRELMFATLIVVGVALLLWLML